MPTPKDIIPSIWHNIFKCMYTKCAEYPEIIYGNPKGIGFIVLCQNHYDLVSRFKGSCADYWQVVANMGGDT